MFDVSCVVIYTDQNMKDGLPDSLTAGKSIEGFTKFYKVPIAVSTLKQQSTV
ncbi:hypothetical protein [Psychrobacter sp. DAB_AL32B]|uniref:hypothetical protein n=1 Tax=Psychrobacter sp. DAB_AL32B TaxID=1028414 RepID=UPI0013FDC025|nr:hypothetical protein [Psychrobacter sp. DAB_AL32B]